MDSWENLEQDALGSEGCKFAKFLASLSPEAQDHVEKAMLNKKITGKALYRALRARGMDCKHTVFHEHRNSTCICFIQKD